jgi:dihydroorotate dehydrogenase electron transfer subunit
MSTAVRHRYQGRAEGPVQQEGEVVDRRRLGRYWGITVTAGEIAQRAQPGQFVNVAVDTSGTLLRRPFSIAGASPSGPVAGTVDIVVDAHGPGTAALGRARTGDRLTLMGPLGKPFPMPQRRVSAVLVGGGYGAAPLYYMGTRLRAAGHKVGFVVGAADQQRILDPIVPKRMATTTVFTTEDGSMGERGRVTDVLARVLTSTGAEVVYACGPNGMLAAVSGVCEQRGIPCQVAVEEHMACGVGVCMTCVLPIRDRHGDVHNRRVCLDGPVFTSTRIDWEASRYVQATDPAAPASPSGAATPGVATDDGAGGGR